MRSLSRIPIYLVIALIGSFCAFGADFTLTVKDAGNPNKDVIYNVLNFASTDAVSFPILFQGRPCVFTLIVYTQQDTKARTLIYTIADPSYMSSTGSAMELFHATFPYTTEPSVLFSSDNLKLISQIKEPAK